jgi:general secretion pathway protein J
MACRSTSQRGFTLLELLVALTIFIMVGIGAQAMLQSVLKARDTVHRHALELARLQKTMSVLERDITQMEPASLILSSGNFEAGFLRRGWSNPLALPRSGMQRVAYALEGQAVRRYYWPAERAGDAPLVQTLDEGISGFEISMVSPHAVEVRLATHDFGQLRRVFEVSEP